MSQEWLIVNLGLPRQRMAITVVISVVGYMMWGCHAQVGGSTLVKFCACAVTHQTGLVQ